MSPTKRPAVPVLDHAAHVGIFTSIDEAKKKMRRKKKQ